MEWRREDRERGPVCEHSLGKGYFRHVGSTLKMATWHKA